MTTENEFREPVFVRSDDTTEIRASVVVWGAVGLSGASVLLKGTNESVLINAEDWPTLVACINQELERVR